MNTALALVVGLFSCIGLAGGDASYHAIYISVIEITHETKAASARMQIKVFTNDMEDALVNTFGKRISFNKLEGCSSVKPMIEKYFDEHFSATVNAQTLQWRLVNCEVTGEAVWFSFQCASPKEWKAITLFGDFLMELFPTQTNIVTVYDSDEKRFAKLHKARTRTEIKF